MRPFASSSRVVRGEHYPTLPESPCRFKPPLVGGEAKPKSSPGSVIFSEHAWREVVDHLGFSQREAEIVRAVFDDRTELAIAIKLGISPHTVHTHLERLHRKLGVSDRVQLVLCIMQEFLRLEALQPELRHRLPLAPPTIQRRPETQAA